MAGKNSWHRQSSYFFGPGAHFSPLFQNFETALAVSRETRQKRFFLQKSASQRCRIIGELNFVTRQTVMVKKFNSINEKIINYGT